jgi:hypothetical protein
MRTKPRKVKFANSFGFSERTPRSPASESGLLVEPLADEARGLTAGQDLDRLPQLLLHPGLYRRAVQASALADGIQGLPLFLTGNLP